MGAPQLTAGFITQRLFDNNDNADLLTSLPTVQILSIKKTNAQDDPQVRYRLILSDGEHYDQSMLHISLNYFIEQDDIIKNSVVVLEDLEVATPRDQRCVALLCHCLPTTDPTSQTACRQGSACGRANISEDRRLEVLMATCDTRA